MDLPDNNVLISAFRPDSQHHNVAKDWLETELNGGQPMCLFPTVETGFLRIVTHPKVFDPPSSLAEALDFLRTLSSSPLVEICPWRPSARKRWGDLCQELGMSGNDCNDAMLAAVALDRGLRVVTLDKGFRRFLGLNCLLLSE